MSNIITESFSWLTPAFKTQDIGPNTIRIKGIALKSDIVSKNQRKYVNEEIQKSGRTLINKPITINHNDNQIVGNVDWAEPENGVLEYLATIKKQPYVEMIRHKDSRIKGVSVDADYLHAQCVLCGQRFYDLETFNKHMVEDEHVKNFEIEPHQILFKALSLVVDPEVPGVPGTSIELMETAKQFKPLLQLLETVTKNGIGRERMTKANVGLEKESTIAIGKSKPKLKEEESKEQKPLVKEEKKEIPPSLILPKPPEPMPQSTESKPISLSEPPKMIEIIVKPVITMAKLNLKTLETAPKFTLGEPFASYTDFADCVSKNQDKDNPEAYCATIKRQVEGETYFRQIIVEAINTLIEQTSKPLTFSIPDIASIPVDDKSWEPRIKLLETKEIPLDDKSWEQKCATKDEINTIKESLPKAYDDTQLKELIANIKKDYETILNGLDEKYREFKETMEQKVAKLEQEKADLTKNIQEKEKQSLKETENLVVRVDNLEDKVKGTFKGKAQFTPQTAVTSDKNPYTGK